MVLYVHQHSDKAGKKTAKEAAHAMTNYIIHYISWEWTDEVIQQPRNYTSKRTSDDTTLQCFVDFVIHGKSPLVEFVLEAYVNKIQEVGFVVIDVW